MPSGESTTTVRITAAAGPETGSLTWNPAGAAEIVRWRLPHAGLVDRLVIKSVSLVARRQVRAIHGLENLRAAPDPVIVAVNHTIRREALYVPALLVLHRGGKWIRFLADWNFVMIPVIGWIIRRAGAIVVTRKPARPRFLNRLKRFYESPLPVADRVRAYLKAGEWVGLFPEGTASRDPRRLLYGRVGMARLSLEAGVAVLPVGIRFPEARPDEPIPEDAVMEVHVGKALIPPADGQATVTMVRAWHARIMSEIGRLSGKFWRPRQQGNDDGS
ncbi:MAG: lysophospholipid acyltransferase family protein [Bauldia sp.]